MFESRSVELLNKHIEILSDLTEFQEGQFIEFFGVSPDLWCEELRKLKNHIIEYEQEEASALVLSWLEHPTFSRILSKITSNLNPEYN